MYHINAYGGEARLRLNSYCLTAMKIHINSGFFVIQAAKLSLVKSATILDPFGGSEAVPGAIITYQLVATTTGSGTINNLSVTDDIPTNTTYSTESISLDGTGLTDSDTDADAGSFDGSQIAVALGSVPGGQTRTISFKVTIDSMPTTHTFHFLA